MSEKPTNPDELSFLKPLYTENAEPPVEEMTSQESSEQRETTRTEPETESHAQSLQQFIDEVEGPVAAAGEEIPTGTIEGYVKYDGPKPERVKDPVMNPGALRVRSWHNEEDGTDVTWLLFGPQAVDSPTAADGSLELRYTRDIAGQLVEVNASVMYPSLFRSSSGNHAQWEAGKGISGNHQGGPQSGPMNPEEAQQALSGVLGRFDELLGEAGL